ncbi:hypothetical protein [Verticiella sediminum]|uniref:hypothetical protein n=1 Tax=Verticiella sediminum TaxID=1247510 RepID=UPI00147901A0|nr:hypothetical protein [Verticiella sediminum]
MDMPSDQAARPFFAAPALEALDAPHQDTAGDNPLPNAMYRRVLGLIDCEGDDASNPLRGNSMLVMTRLLRQGCRQHGRHAMQNSLDGGIHHPAPVVGLFRRLAR